MSQPFTVTLTPHEASKETPRGPIPVQFAQDLIFLNGVHVGYVGHQLGAPVMTIVHFDPATSERLREEVAALRKVSTGPINQPPTDDQMAELADDDEDDEDDDEDDE